MVETFSFKRLILRVVLRRVSPMVIRLVSVSDQIKLPEFHQIFCAMLGWNGDLGYIVRVHGQEFNSLRRKTRSKALHELELHRQEKFLYICDTLHMWEWDVRVVDIQEGTEHNLVPICLGGRGATPPELCGGPTGYRLMLKRQQDGAAMSDPLLLEADDPEALAKEFHLCRLRRRLTLPKIARSIMTRNDPTQIGGQSGS